MGVRDLAKKAAFAGRVNWWHTNASYEKTRLIA
jgi:hypothetical protein